MNPIEVVQRAQGVLQSDLQKLTNAMETEINKIENFDPDTGRFQKMLSDKVFRTRIIRQKRVEAEKAEQCSQGKSIVHSVSRSRSTSKGKDNKNTSLIHLNKPQSIQSAKKGKFELTMDEIKASRYYSPEKADKEIVSAKLDIQNKVLSAKRTLMVKAMTEKKKAHDIQ